MKKLALAAALLLSVGVTGAFACGGHHYRARVTTPSCSYHSGACHNYYDANGDGVCDYYGTYHHGGGCHY